MVAALRPVPVNLEEVLRASVRGAVRTDVTSRAVFAADASNYRHVPLAVVQPVDGNDLVAVLEACARAGAPVVLRGAGTSIGGQAVGEAVVVDCSRHLDRILAIDAGDPVDGRAPTARVEPGVVLDRLQERLAPLGLRFGPDPSTHSRATIGGMIGNNACGSHSVAWGKTVDNVEALTVLTPDGVRLTVGATDDGELARRCALPGREGEIYRGLRDLRDEYATLVRERFPDLTRRVSGYNLDQLLPENGFHVARALVGTEGTCVTILDATVSLVRPPAHRALVVAGYPDSFAAADHVPRILGAGPLAVEGIDDGLVAALLAADPRATVDLPPGRGWLFVEMGGATEAEAAIAAGDLTRALADEGVAARLVTDAVTMRQLWKIREDGAGIVTRSPDGGEAWPGWEDAAVPPERLGGYLRGFSRLLAEHGLAGAYYGHFGDGCIHVRINFDLLTDAGVARFRAFMFAAAELVVAHGGSLSGEHGDGQARSELLATMYPPELLTAFARFKAVWDPDGSMNPGIVVEPRRLDDDLRVHTGRPTIDLRTALAIHADDGDFARSTRRCMGVGKCVTASGGVMCPSWRATGEEQHSTRGRARLLFEMASGHLVEDGWRSTEVRDALDLCLSCKGCKKDCPVGVDMATYKAEFLHHHYRGRLRPRTHYSMGWLPLLLRAGARAPGLFNAVADNRLAAGALRAVGGLDRNRSLPHLAARSFVDWWRARPARPDGDPVLLWPDTFTNYFDPEVGIAAVEALEALGHRVEVPTGPVCCGLTWLSTGQLGVARAVLRRSLGVLGPWLEAGVPIVGLEPSCAGLLRSDAAELLPDDPRVPTLARSVRSFAEQLAADRADGRWPEAAARGPRERAVVQIHCHQYAEVGVAADREVLSALGMEADILDSGCCGLAGNFGFEAGHYDVSMACAERVLLPAVRDAAAGDAILADGFSCRTQVAGATDRRPEHLAQVAARRLTGG